MVVPLLRTTAAFAPQFTVKQNSIHRSSSFAISDGSSLYGAKKSRRDKEGGEEGGGSPLDRTKQNHEKWQPFFDSLSQFQQQHGHCNVSDMDDPNLSMWLTEQRTSYRNLKLKRKTKLTRTRAAALEMIGAIPADLLDL